MRLRLITLISIVSAVTPFGCVAQDGDTAVDKSLNAAERGYRVLTETPLLSSDFDQETFDNVWRVWPDALRDEAESADLAGRRRMALRRYGLTLRPEALADSLSSHGPSEVEQPSDRPLQYVVGSEGHWTMNCFACHGGTVDGQPYPGAPNWRLSLEGMTEELRTAKMKIGKPLSRMDLGSMIIPLGSTNGTTNAVVFGMGLMHNRDPDLNPVSNFPRMFTHHDMDAPPWWHFAKRPFLYIDGFAQKGHRGLMQFAMIPENDAQFFRDQEDNFRDVYAYINSIDPPKYPGDVDGDLAGQGRAVFESNCASCHGTYGDEFGRHDDTYPNVRIPIEEIGTDPVRLTALPVSGRQKYAASWFAHAGEPDEQFTTTDPDGYTAPPLDGVWASAPYFHNGSVPTLHDVLHPSDRPVVWRPTDDRVDRIRMGVAYEALDPDRMPQVADPVRRRDIFDTRRYGKSNRGHRFVDELTADEKRAVLEYLKTL